MRLSARIVSTLLWDILRSAGAVMHFIPLLNLLMMVLALRNVGAIRRMLVEGTGCYLFIRSKGWVDRRLVRLVCLVWGMVGLNGWIQLRYKGIETSDYFL